MSKSLIVKTILDQEIFDLAVKTDCKTLGVWAADCVTRVLPFFEARYPNEARPRQAIDALRVWTKTGIFKMADVRRVALASHAAARDVTTDDVARSVARAAGQALATAHVKTHSVAAALYSATAIRDVSDPNDAIDAVNQERQWQYQHLKSLCDKIRCAESKK